MRKLLVLTAICLTVIVSANGAMAQSYVQNDRLTCGCDNPTTPADECIVIIGSPGDACPTNATHFVQNDQATCGCDNPTTGSDECSSNCGALCETIYDPGNGQFIEWRNCLQGCMSDPCNSEVDHLIPACSGGGGGGGGCFAAATDIMMEDGTLKKIVDLKIGDRVMSFDKKVGAESDLVGNRVTHIFLMGEKDVYDLRGTLVTGTHKFLTGAGEMVAVQDLKPGDMLVLADGTQVPSGELKIVGREPVYNFTVESAHSYVADGVRTGNMTVPSLPEGVYTEHDLLLKNVAMNNLK